MEATRNVNRVSPPTPAFSSPRHLLTSPCLFPFLLSPHPRLNTTPPASPAMEAASTDTANEAPVSEPPEESPTKARPTDMPNGSPREPPVEASAVIEKPKDKGKWLPLEIQIMIIHLLDTPSYVEEHLEDDPADFFDLEGRPQGPKARQDLKNASLVCRAWHREVRPLLFQHLNLRFRTPTEAYNDEIPDESGDYEEAICFLQESSDFLSTVLESVTLSLVLPGFLEQQKEEIERFSYRMDSEEREIVSALTPIDCYRAEDFSIFDSLEDQLSKLRPRRITVLATGAAMAVFLHNHFRYPASYCMIEDPRLQLLSVSRRQRYPGNDCELRGNRMMNLLWLVEGDDVVINDGSLRWNAFRRGDYEPSCTDELDLHQILLESLPHVPQPIRLKSLSFVSLFNFQRGFIPISHEFVDVLDPSTPITETNMLNPDIYSHRILPQGEDLESVLSSMFPRERPEERGSMRMLSRKGFTYRTFFDRILDLSSYESLFRDGMDWARAYHFQDVGTLCNPSQWSTIRARCQRINNGDLLYAAMGWFVSESCLTELEWRESGDDDKREVIEMMDREDWKEQREEEDDMEDEWSIDEEAMMAEEALLDAEWDAELDW
ncbi:hypothetical protein CC79DRAFT_1116737 [Sarocladium strictum]